MHLTRHAIDTSILRLYTLPFIINSWSGSAPIVTPHQLWYHLFQHVDTAGPHSLDGPHAYLPTDPTLLASLHVLPAHPSCQAPTPGHPRMQAAHPPHTPMPSPPHLQATHLPHTLMSGPPHLQATHLPIPPTAPLDRRV